MSGGRPTKYDPELCGKVVALGRDGYTLTEIAAELDVARQTLYNWQEEHPEFLDALTRAKDLAEAWWSKEGRKGIWSRDFNASAYRLQMANRFDWGDKSSHELTGADGGPLSVEVTHRIVDPDADDSD